MTSRSDAFLEREAVRKTWGSHLVNRMGFHLVFVVGKPANTPEAVRQHKLENEHFDDVVTADYCYKWRAIKLWSRLVFRFYFKIS